MREKWEGHNMEKAELNLMERNENVGTYTPAFFHMHLNTDKPISYSGDEEVQSVFFHEYIHFLQDITTYAGLNNIYCISEYIREVALYYATKNPFYVPVKLENNESYVRINDTINRETAGDKNNSISLDIFDIQPNEYSDQDLKSIGIELISVPLLFTSERYWKFGRREIMESMAYILQRKCTQCPPTVLFPYYAAEKAAQFLYPGNFSENLENILALCDISLMSSNPGNTFVRCVEMIRDKKWKVEHPEDIYDNFYSSCARTMECVSSPIILFANLSFVVRQSLKEYIYQKEIAEHLHPWIDLVFKTGANMRLNDRYFFLELARGGNYLKNAKFMSLFKTIGSPIVENNLGNFHRFPSTPDYGDFFQYLSAFETIYKIYKDGCFQCTMQTFCKHSMRDNPNIVVDEQCEKSPWTKISKEREICPVAFLFHHRILATNPPIKRC